MLAFSISQVVFFQLKIVNYELRNFLATFNS